MATFNNGEGGLSIRTKINEAIEKVDGTAPITAIDVNGGSIDGAIIGANDPVAVTATNLAANTDLTIAASTTVTAILDEDDLVSDSATALATQQSIKSYVDGQVESVNELSEILDNGNTSGANDIIIDASQKITVDNIDETTADGGVTIDGVLLKDGEVDGRDVAVDGTKLDGIEASADVTDTENVTAAGALMTSGGAMTGAISTNSTFDGRDVAADGSKLDTIESNADVTDTTNVTAAGALMDSEITNLAQVKAFDSSDYATASQGTLADSAVQPNDSPVFGSVTVTGTVDGRDVATDGTKLDGIEANADVTDTTNVTAAGALMDSEVTNLAQVKAFDSSDYATAAQGALADSAVQPNDSPTFGSVTVTGTVDGRDVAADGTKLDGIEVGADVTDTANVTSAGALMDSELTSIASVKALNQGVATTDGPTFAGLTSTSHVSLGDNDELRLGDSDDLTIEHNATNGIIANNTNNLYLTNTANDKDVYIQSDDGSGGIANYFAADGSTGEAKMYYYGAEKLNTTSGGVDVTGSLTTSDEVVAEVVSYAPNQNAPYMIAATTSYTGATTNVGTYGYQHRLKLDSNGTSRITVDGVIGGVETELWALYGGTGNMDVYGSLAVSDVDIGRGGGGVYSNTALGTQTLTSNTTGGNNSATGYHALYDNSTGNNNVANGYQALRYNTTGPNNVAIGLQALRYNTTGGNNAASGTQALNSNTTGGNNVATGHQALYSNTTAGQNSATGYQALYSNSTGANNSATGYQALYSNSTGGNNAASGTQALYSNTTGGGNAASGHQALYSNTTGFNNVATGFRALNFNSTASNNTANGYEALYSNTTGGNSVATGFQALRSNTTGGNSVATGFQALLSNTTGANNSATGYRALLSNTTGRDNVALGLQALQNNTTGSGNFGAAFRTSSSTYSPVFDPTTENNRVVMGHTAVTNAYVQVAWTVVSDKRDKTQIEPMQHGLDFVEQLNPVSYKFRVDRDTEETNGKKHYGFLAQDVLAIEGENNVIVDNEDPDKLRMTNEELIPVLVNAIKELKAEVETLKGKLA